MSVTAYFIGPDDDVTCVEPDGGCVAAVENNPYTIDDVPEPGIVGVCGPFCRHMIQLADDAPEGTPQYTWRASLGFQEEPGPIIATSQTRTFADDLNLDQPMDALASEMKARGIDFDAVAPFIEDVADKVKLAEEMNPNRNPQDMVDGWLGSDDADLLAGLLTDKSAAMEYALRLAEHGFDQHEAQKAYTLADALNSATDTRYTVRLNSLDNRWYVTPQ